jgi:hypothetical protein
MCYLIIGQNLAQAVYYTLIKAYFRLNNWLMSRHKVTKKSRFSYFFSLLSNPQFHRTLALLRAWQILQHDHFRRP